MRRRSLLAAVSLILALALPLGALADDPPPPVVRHQFRTAALPVTGPTELVKFVLEFQPGAQTPPHTHPGILIATVLEGEITFSVGGTEKVYKPGDTLVERPNEVGVARNTAPGRTRVMTSVLTPKGAAPSTPQPGGPSPAPPAPTTLYLFRADAFLTATPHDLVHVVHDFAPGAQTPQHTHPGQVFVTVLDGEITFSSEGATKTYRVGESFVERPDVVGQARNAGGTPATALVTYLLPQGAPLSQPLIPGPPPGGSGGNLPGLPSTGAGAGAGQGLSPAVPGLVSFIGGALLAGGWGLRRRARRN